MREVSDSPKVKKGHDSQSTEGIQVKKPTDSRGERELHIQNVGLQRTNTFFLEWRSDFPPGLHETQVHPDSIFNLKKSCAKTHSHR